MRPTRWTLSSLCLTAVAACSAEAGVFEIQTEWPGDQRPNFQAEGWTPYLRLQLLKDEAPIWSSPPIPLSVADFAYSEVPHDVGLQARVEITDGIWTNARVRYRGLSAPFDFEPGASVTVTVPLSAADAPTGAAVPLALDRIRYERSPWGRVDDRADSEARVVGTPGAAPPDAVEVLILSERDVARAEVLGRRPISEDGEGAFEVRFNRPLSSEADRVAVAFIDADLRLTDSSTEAGLQAAFVRRTRWTANLRQKVVGSDFPNPHALMRSRRAAPARWLAPEVQADVTAAEYADLAALDDRSVVARADRRWLPVSSLIPAGRLEGHLAYDEERGDLVLFGGTNSAFNRLADLWRWTDRGWVVVPVATEPPAPRGGAAFRYHRGLGGLVLFGGDGETTDGETLDDTWILRGTQWSRVPAAGPPARSDMAFAYDARRDVLWMFGGCGRRPSDFSAEAGATCDQPLGDLWALDRDGWRRVEGATPPPSPRAGASMAYDPERDRLLLFGGDEGAPDSYKDDRFWSFSPGDGVWSPIPVAAGGPPPQSRLEAAFDAARGTLLVAGGTTTSGVVPAGAWAWDGEQWRRVSDDRGPDSVSYLSMAAHPRLGEIVVFGGTLRLGASVLRDAWTWNGARWRPLHTQGAEPRLEFATASTDPVTRSILLLAGRDAVTKELNTTMWRYDGQWSVVEPGDDIGPNPRVFAGSAYYPPLGGTVIVGGWSAFSEEPIRYRDAWVFRDGLWRTIIVRGTAPRGHARAVYDPVRQELVVTAENGVFALTSSAGVNRWSQDRDAPPPREAPGLVYDEARRRVVLFGGLDETRAPPGDPGLGLLDDTWARSESGEWTQLPASPFVGPRYQMAMVYDPVRQVVVMHGGAVDLPRPGEGKVSRPFIADDTWELEGDSWRFAEVQTTRPHRFAHAGAYDLRRGEVVLVGGIGDYEAGSTVRLVGPDTLPLDAPSSPGRRCGHQVGYQPSLGRGVLFGGCTRPPPAQVFSLSGCQAVASTWLWTGYSWTRSPGAEARPRTDYTAYVDPASGRYYVLGGRSAAIVPADAWVFAESTWSRLDIEGFALFDVASAWEPDRGGALAVGGVGAPASGPATWGWTPEDGPRPVDNATPDRRRAAALAYDEARQTHVLFGGQRIADGELLGDTWVRGADTWQRVDATGPAPRIDHGFAYDSARGRVVMVGGISDDRFLEDAWEWTGERWNPIPAPGFVHLRDYALFYDPERRALIAHGGFRNTICGNDTSILSLDPERRPEIRARFDYSVTRERTETIEGVEIRLTAGGRGFSVNRTGPSAPVPGFVLEAWSARKGQWRAVATSSADISSLQTLTVRVDEQPLELVGPDAQIDLRVRPVAGDGSGAVPSEIRLDAIEISVDYTWN